jgi:hypothetical protein
MTRPRTSPRRRGARLALGALALAILTPTALPGAGCGAQFDPPSKVDSLRVLTVVADKPYAQPGETVELHMSLADRADLAGRRIQITWIGGCFDPEGDQYYACYEQLAEAFQGLSASDLLSSEYFQQLDSDDPNDDARLFSLRIPDDIISRRERPEAGPYYGISYVFFVACAGFVGPVPPSGDGAAGSFPLGCFDTQGQRLGNDHFVVGYTQIYSFEDGRTNQNPPIRGFSFDGEVSPAERPVVERCPVSEEERRASGCGQQDPFADCKQYDIDVAVDGSASEVDPSGETPDGKPLRETVWVDYFGDGGDYDKDIKLVFDAVTGANDDHKVSWVPPAEAGVVKLWAVLRDARGGSTLVEQEVEVR